MTKSTWTPQDDAKLRELWPCNPKKVVMAALGRKATSIYDRAKLLGIKRTPEYLASVHANTAANVGPTTRTRVLDIVRENQGIALVLLKAKMQAKHETNYKATANAVDGLLKSKQLENRSTNPRIKMLCTPGCKLPKSLTPDERSVLAKKNQADAMQFRSAATLCRPLHVADMFTKVELFLLQLSPDKRISTDEIAAHLSMQKKKNDLRNTLSQMVGNGSVMSKDSRNSSNLYWLSPKRRASLTNKKPAKAVVVDVAPNNNQLIYNPGQCARPEGLVAFKKPSLVHGKEVPYGGIRSM